MVIIVTLTIIFLSKNKTKRRFILLVIEKTRRIKTFMIIFRSQLLNVTNRKFRILFQFSNKRKEIMEPLDSKFSRILMTL